MDEVVAYKYCENCKSKFSVTRRVRNRKKFCCDTCAKSFSSRNNKNTQATKAKYKASEKGKAVSLKYRASEKGKSTARKAANSIKGTEAKKRYLERNPLKKVAHSKVSNALRDGRIQKPLTCQRCKQIKDLQGHHHRGYEPEFHLDVLWLCPQCHKKAHEEDRE